MNSDKAEKLGEAIALLGAVSKPSDYYLITQAAKPNYRVWRDDRGVVQCNCEAYKQNKPKDSAFRCKHIFAVRYFANEMKGIAPVKSETEFKPKSDRAIREVSIRQYYKYTNWDSSEQSKFEKIYGIQNGLEAASDEEFEAFWKMMKAKRMV